MSILLEELRKKYGVERHEPRENCRYCQGTGERDIQKTSPLTGKPIGIRPCICIYVDHAFCDWAAETLGQVARNVIQDFKAHP